MGEMRKFLAFRWFAFCGLAIVAMLILSLLAQIENWKRDLSINYASLDPESDDPSMHPPIIVGTPPDVAQRIMVWAEQTPRWAVESQVISDQQAKIHLTRTTRIFRWVDDIHVQISQVDGGVRVDAESKSRVGKGDLGQNPRNLRELVAALNRDQ